jgi:hypothetical protein
MKTLIECLQKITDESCPYCRETIKAVQRMASASAGPDPVFRLSFDRDGGRRWHIGITTE